MTVRARVVLVLAVLTGVLLSLPDLAHACPSCATREGPGKAVYLLIGLMIAAPYLIAMVAIRIMRRLERGA